jgi:hypothetical protein
MRILIALPIAVALATGPALAEEAKQPEDKIVCKRNETYMTGSRLSRPKKTCMKASEWKELDRERDTTLSRIRDGKLNPNQPGGMGAPGN